MTDEEVLRRFLQKSISSCRSDFSRDKSMRHRGSSRSYQKQAGIMFSRNRFNMRRDCLVRTPSPHWRGNCCAQHLLEDIDLVGDGASFAQPHADEQGARQ
jgi:hypothetical protein